MWPLGRIKTAPRSRSFSCSSFKDIQNLCTEESEPEPDSPRTPSIFHRVRISSWAHRNAAPPSPPTLHHHHHHHSRSSSDMEKPAVVVYFTSLRVVRKTFEDCRAVLSILRGLRVPVDERDLSMDSRYVAELQGILGRMRLSLPCVIVGGRLVGGAEEVRKLHESGELRSLVAGRASPAARRPRRGPARAAPAEGRGTWCASDAAGAARSTRTSTGSRAARPATSTASSDAPLAPLTDQSVTPEIANGAGTRRLD